METMKSLNEVLPVEKRLQVSTAPTEILDREIALIGASKPPVANSKFYTVRYTVVGEDIPRYTMFAQEQITSILDYLIDNSLFPIRAMVILSGKSYAMVDPSARPSSDGEASA